MSASIQFVPGVDEPVIPDIRMTRSRDGVTGRAIFTFEKPMALAPGNTGDITGEGQLVTRDVKARFVNGLASALECTYIWKSLEEFERFMRFAERYAAVAGLGFDKAEA
ncbi:MAG: photosystem II reaction center protein Psb28 [Aphanocapsa feldmannii 277cI]|uniref:Photosystem II reaction center Psb28 protein n=1 Tax=Aphanocapsa feldmannii 277cI TaxID=2507554 RepID=A0A524RTQ9_9CHRO|nr:MAG: photosystem II reaction center protein Psb28 [Aphanocapsa feldmannii 277cI]